MKNRYFLIALALAAAPAFAFNTSAFRDAPFTRLTETEVKAFREAVLNALDTAPEGTTVEWKAPKTQFTSRITPGNTVNGIERICRNATIESEAKDRFQRGNYSFCKTPGGKWQLASPGSKSGKK
jgi:surface antigen